MKRAVLLALGAGVLAVGWWLFARYAEPRGRAEELRRDLRERRLAVDSCRMALSAEEARFRDFDERVDSLRERVRDLEALHPEGVPADSFRTYLEVFGSYNEAIPSWEARAESLQRGWEDCTAMVEEHNEMADSLRMLLVEIGELPDGAPDESRLDEVAP